MARVLTVLISVLALVSTQATALQPQVDRDSTSDERYVEVIAAVRDAFDKGTTERLRSVYLRNEKSVHYSFGVALLDFYERRLYTKLNINKGNDEWEELEDTRRRILKCMEEETSSAYPTALYAWYVDTNREPNMAPPNRETISKSQTTTSTGQIVPVEVVRVVSDPFKDARVDYLLAQAKRLDQKNPLIRYIEASRVKPKEDSAPALLEVLGEPGQYLWETDALYRVRIRTKDDDVQKQVAERTKVLKELIGPSSIRIRAYRL